LEKVRSDGLERELKETRDKLASAEDLKNRIEKTRDEWRREALIADGRLDECACAFTIILKRLGYNGTFPKNESDFIKAIDEAFKKRDEDDAKKEQAEELKARLEHNEDWIAVKKQLAVISDENERLKKSEEVFLLEIKRMESTRESFNRLLSYEANKRIEEWGRIKEKDDRIAEVIVERDSIGSQLCAMQKRAEKAEADAAEAKK
jgi:hypothetical protein